MKKKIWLSVGLLVLLILIILGVIWGPKVFSFYWYEYLSQKYLAEFEEIELSYKVDKNGGSTPQETLDLFVSALRAKDAKLAASYFVPEKRGEMEGAIKNWEKNKRIEFIISELNKVSFFIEDDSCIGESINEKKEVELSVYLIKNKFSQKWLIESL